MKNKTTTTLLATFLGALGAHRFYLKGFGDIWGWLHVAVTSVGLVGIRRITALGHDDRLAWALLPFLGISITAACLQALVIGLSKQDSPYSEERTTPLTIAAVVAALLLGATALMSSIAYALQRYFELNA